MKPNTCLLIDTWENLGAIDESVLKSSGVAGIGIRLNDINGGHHMDTAFVKQWDEARTLVRFPHFTYSPAVSSQDNHDWLVANLPSDAKSVAIDVVAPNGTLSPTKYAANLDVFLKLCAGSGWKTIIYTAAWCLPFLSVWPKAEYWWAQWPSPTGYAANVSDWASLETALEALDIPNNSTSIPGALKMWQFSGNHFVLPGCANKLNLSIFYGTETNLAEYFVSFPAASQTYPRLMRVKDDLEAGSLSRPFLRNGLPSTVRIRGGKGFVRLTTSWLNYVAKLNTVSAYSYIFKDASGWHNQGDMVRVEQLTFSGNIVKVNRVSNGRAYIDAFFLSDTPPASAPTLSIANLSPVIQFFTTQYNTYLDMSTDGRWPKILVIANPGEELWMNVNDLADYHLVNSQVSVTVGVLNIRLTPSKSSKKAGTKVYGNRVTIYGISQIGYDYWGRIDLNTWIALKLNGDYYTTWREALVAVASQPQADPESKPSLGLDRVFKRRLRNGELSGE